MHLYVFVVLFKLDICSLFISRSILQFYLIHVLEELRFLFVDHAVHTHIAPATLVAWCILLLSSLFAVPASEFDIQEVAEHLANIECPQCYDKSCHEVDHVVSP